MLYEVDFVIVEPNVYYSTAGISRLYLVLISPLVTPIVLYPHNITWCYCNTRWCYAGVMGNTS